ncbi:uncharacterized protein (TIGR02328 family) [Clostridium acetobutylicum]|uniref:Pyrimidine dimer DNA glycosylase n=1 Tax=Clostridium acetobutylicum (strain ATCC 824 / DSM 792 / JCM 1419 / IAM 19013 / LMG 5710 / NBRC 13948 / NRRL B-527 / VKM B-1787 / 2291 / W) TaxID=272562 RepID=Q97IR5_CLOAB|nr:MULTISPECIES: TIGR02328 family protein [Clostridium]AAK79542.1 Hypothetical protein CA_C1575 [Clostridium acetobutylicum ATCC 824]ADZ20627.1 Conserved hypothetical protein [Clostridium acetobutylicum EA 2018]AEI31876.1 hypothetical protein SMB_G1600 [Clostridium acetobutylicum DSM 1731]AWV81215.1 hypothetical protein DK921_14165 [Clostridium acetobutylicum]MBC2392846.1 hypothetical protein [Clostridium acetobutylicum]
MRLWHQSLITKLPRQQLLGQHRECCALRGNAWGKKHSVVDYVFCHPMEYLVAYHLLVMEEMATRNYNVSDQWMDYNYRGKNCEKANLNFELIEEIKASKNIYKEHDDEYLNECLANLRNKGIELF